MVRTSRFNAGAAEIFRECGRLLEQQGGNPFQVKAYLRAAGVLESLSVDATDILRQEGRDGLMRLPGIGRGLAAAIDEIGRTGRLARLDRLRGDADPEALLQTVPGIGPALARLLHEALDVDSLEALEVAAYDGSLDSVPGVGRRRLFAIRSALAAILGPVRSNRRHATSSPSIELLLEVDREYRKLAKSGKLPKIAPRRFNPEKRAWLPVLHTERDGWHFTVLFSNTAQANKLGRTDDWVVAYFYNDDHEEGQHTIVTETHGALKGKRVVRGREAECGRLQQKSTAVLPVGRDPPP
jgi:putative hydrolase